MADSIKTPICGYSDLNLMLDSDLTRKFQSMFYDFTDDGIRVERKSEWKLFLGDLTP